MTGTDGFSGANPDELDALARSMDESADRLASTGAALDRAVASMTWSGPDAVRFRSSWAGHRRRLQRTREELADRARFVREQAEDQRRASASTTGAWLRGLPPGSVLGEAVPAPPGEGTTVTVPVGGVAARVSIALGGPSVEAVTEARAGLGARIGAEAGLRPLPTVSPADLLRSLRDRLGPSDWMASR